WNDKEEKLLCCSSNTIWSPEALSPPRRSDIERPSPEFHFVTQSSTKLHHFSLSLFSFQVRKPKKRLDAVQLGLPADDTGRPT
ncbi:unnamed protein product, partial [Brassica rapa subsp. narinosa]